MLRSKLAARAMRTFGLQIAAQGLSFVLAVLLARVLGASGYGIYANSYQWLQLLVVPATLGMNQLLVREVAKYAGAGEWSLAKGFIAWASLRALAASAVLMIAGSGVAALLWLKREPEMLTAVFYTLLVLLPLTALINLRQAAMRGLERVAQGLYPDLIVRPAIAITVVGVAALLRVRFTALDAVIVSILATLIAFLIGTRMLSRSLPRSTVRARLTSSERQAWVASAVPMMFIGGMWVLINRTAAVVLGAMHEPAQVGIYAAASRGAALINFVPMAVNLVVAPSIARLHATGNLTELQRLITKSARATLVASLCVAVVVAAVAPPFLKLFGREFARGIALVWILSIGEVVSAAMGSVGLILIMTGHERTASRALASSVVVTVLLSAVLIPKWSATGAAIADISALIAANLLLAWLVYAKTGLEPTAIPLFGPLTARFRIRSVASGARKGSE